MDNIQLLKDLKEDICDLQYGNNKASSELVSRVDVLVEKFFDSKAKYINELMSIRYLFMGINCGGIEYKKEIKWKEGEEKLDSLINTLIYDLELSENSQDKKLVTKKRDNSKVFIIHGHDDGAKNEVARFIERLGFEAKILHEQVDSGATIIEKLEKHTDVGFAIVLYTSCDIGGAKSDLDNLKPRARQNVIFEHGLLIGKIGRANVVALVKGDVEIPNDISGVVYKSMDIGGAWKYSIAREMKISGYDVDMNKVE